jgi:7-cyano-7-deazaguanine synthase
MTRPETPATGAGRLAVVLLSGGMDSATALAWARASGFECHSLAVDYGQRHRIELAAAQDVARALGVRSHRQIAIDLRAIGGSALTSDLGVPKHRPLPELGREIPITYVPARNTTFLSLALGLAEVVGARDLVVGVNALDYSGYPDCRPEFLAAFEALAGVATRAGVAGTRFEIHAPLMTLDKAGIVRLGLSLGVDFGRTHSCYDPAADGTPCGGCDACQLRRKGFQAAGVPDPLHYASPLAT